MPGPTWEDDRAMRPIPRSIITADQRPPAGTLTHAEFMRIYPRIAGGAESEEEKLKRELEEAKAATAKAEQDAADALKKLELGEGGQAAIDKERADAKQAKADAATAKKALEEAQAKLDKIEADGLSEAEKLKKEAEEGRQVAATATEKLRKANLIAELSKKENGVKDARAAAGLINGVEFDDNDEPTNLGDRVKALVEDYPVLKGAGGSTPNLNGNEGGNEGDPPQLTAEELEVAKSFGMTPEEYAKEKDPAYEGEPAKT